MTFRQIQSTCLAPWLNQLQSSTSTIDNSNNTDAIKHEMCSLENRLQIHIDACFTRLQQNINERFDRLEQRIDKLEQHRRPS
jgi:hypothetical protein